MIVNGIGAPVLATDIVCAAGVVFPPAVTELEKNNDGVLVTRVVVVAAVKSNSRQTHPAGLKPRLNAPAVAGKSAAEVVPAR